MNDLRERQLVAIVEKRCNSSVLVLALHAVAENSVIEESPRHLLKIERRQDIVKADGGGPAIFPRHDKRGTFKRTGDQFRRRGRR